MHENEPRSYVPALTPLAAIDGFGYVPAKEPPAVEPVATALPEEHAVAKPLVFMVMVANVQVAAVAMPVLSVGFGYVPARSPPAVPFGGSEVGAPVKSEKAPVEATVARVGRPERSLYTPVEATVASPSVLFAVAIVPSVPNIADR